MFLEKNTNLGSVICRLWVIPVAGISSFINGADMFHKVITLVNGESWLEIYFTPGSAEFSQKHKESDPGPVYEQTLKFLFPGDDSSTPGLIDQVMNRPVVVLMQLSDDQYRLMGSPDNGARISFSQQTGPKVNGREIVASCTSQDPSWWDSSPNYPPGS